MGVFDFLKKQKTEPNNNITSKKFIKDDAEYYFELAFEVFCNRNYYDFDYELDDDQTCELWEYAGNQLAYFLTWLIKNDFLTSDNIDVKSDLQRVKDKIDTGYNFLSGNLELKLHRSDLQEEILGFMDTYYENTYNSDYNNYLENTLHKDKYSFGFSWNEYEKFEPTLDKAYKDFKNNN